MCVCLPRVQEKVWGSNPNCPQLLVRGRCSTANTSTHTHRIIAGTVTYTTGIGTVYRGHCYLHNRRRHGL